MEELFDDREDIIITFSSIEAKTSKAICADGIWLPRSQIKYEEPSPFVPIEITMPEWLAYEKELI